MAYLALYRKYRPINFEALIGQEHIVKTLTNQIISGRLGHAYLFTGTRGTGKTSAAKIFSKAINCLSPINGSPCGKCEACIALNDSSNIDVIEIDAASNNGVNEIRDLREKVQYPPVACRYKVYIIDEVHMLTGAAFNALLKTLEEPPKHAVFILATTEVHKIPATILSRCMRFDFRLISVEEISKLICKIYDEQGKKYEKEAVFAIAKAGEGSIRDALSIADTAISYGTDKLKYDDVLEILGSSNSDTVFNLVKNVLNSDTGKVLQTIDTLCSLGKSMGVLTKDVTKLIRDLLIIKTCNNSNTILTLPKEKFSQYADLVIGISEQRLLRVLEIYSDVETALKYSNHPRVAFETASVKASRPENDYNIDALMSRIKDLEEKMKNGVVFDANLSNDNKKIETIPENNLKRDKKEKIPIQTVTVEELKGKLLVNLRKLGSEMLWNIIQNVEISILGNILVITTANKNDSELLEKLQNKTKIIDALDEFLPFELQIKITEKERNLNELDKATEKIKNIFGDDIVIIK